jgi:hypothetical protein
MRPRLRSWALGGGWITGPLSLALGLSACSVLAPRRPRPAIGILPAIWSFPLARAVIDKTQGASESARRASPKAFQQPYYRKFRHISTGKCASRHLGEKSLALIGNASGKVISSECKSWPEAFSIRRLGGSRWRGGRGSMGFEWPHGCGAHGQRPRCHCESPPVIIVGAANWWNRRLENR